MIHAQSIASPGKILSAQEISATLEQGLGRDWRGQKVLVLIPDHTRSLPLPGLFKTLVDILGSASQITFMVALGTHPPLNEVSLNRLVGLDSSARASAYGHVSLVNHAWDDPSHLVTIGKFDQQEMHDLAGERWHASLPNQVDIRINRASLEHDLVLILGPVFPHEVVGFSGGAKYLFPGISGHEMINATHWLGALSGVVGTIGLKDTPVRRMIHAAARYLSTPVLLAALVVQEHDLAGLFVGDLFSAWDAAADLSAQRNVVWCERAFKQALSCAPAMYDELWTAAKAMYKLESAMQVGSELILYAPHLQTISHTHGQHILELGYHILPYFLENWEHFSRYPLGVLAHSAHLRGSGVLENGIEKPNVRVTLASRIPPDVCDRLNLGYLDPVKLNPAEWQDREEEGILFVPRAGEVLFRVKPPTTLSGA